MLERQADERAEAYISNVDLMHEYQGNLPPCEECPVSQLSSENISISVFGKSKNWKGYFGNNLELFPILHRRKIKRVFIPNISTFTGIIADYNDFPKENEVEGIEIFSGVKAEGLIIPSGSAGFFCTADCPTVIYHDIENDILIAAHAGFASIVDKTRILTGEPSRLHESVVDDIMEKVDDTDHYEVFVLCGIKSSSFSYDIHDPMFGEMNRDILNYLFDQYGTDAVPYGIERGNISLLGIIRKQFSSLGVNPEKIISDNVDTFSDVRFWSHRRYSQMGKVKECGRNGVLVIHSE